MRLVGLLAVSLLAPLALGAGWAKADVLITVDKTTQRTSVSVDGTPRYAWSVSTGKAGYETPVGTFTPSRLVKDHASKEWDNSPMPHSIFFTHRGHAIYGSNATRSLGGPLGTAASALRRQTRPSCLPSSAVRECGTRGS
ncbi:MULTISPECIES: L,D-transpeptidase [Microvirga]|uniref:L,D-transpeptidase n=1 Tax=Microvirga arabica TaxID=1128671 RepID=A0ABV6Y5X6_9HYPH|nr:L,D-transpeptidase [Microvirga arsenatis]